MSLYSSIKEIQKTIEKTYLNVEQRFSENKAIQDLWNKMARDVSQQVDSLNELPRSFWIRLKKDQEELQGTIKKEVQLQNFRNSEDLSLSEYIENAIGSEEAMILKIYVPLIRNLRKNWSGSELNFYIMVKAHIVRFRRVAEAFSGNPRVLQRAALLFEKFEKEVQEPEVDISQIIKPVRKSKTAWGKAASKAKKSPKKKAVKPAAESKPKKTKKKAAKPASESKPKKTKKKSNIHANQTGRRPTSSKPKIAKPTLRQRRS